jgi:class 3 adenylate cyclase/predicted ATPase
MPEVGREAFFFEGYTLDLRRGCLRTADREIELRPKSFAVLRYLVENAGRLVSKDELVKAVWPNVIVTDESLARCVSDVRLALSDSHQRVIKTVPRRGYLLAASVSEPSRSAESVTATSPAATSPDRVDAHQARLREHPAERRQLTVISCELIGLAALSTRLDPEDLRAVTAACHQYCAEIIGEHHGTVARYLGDRLLGYFGYPEAHEHDAENAVRAGLALIGSTARLPATDSAVQLRIGVASGLVVIAEELAAGDAKGLTAVGETPNLAGRLQGAAASGTLVIADTTRRLAGGLFEYRSLGRLMLEGMPEPVHAWEVVGPSAAESRFEALRTGATPLVGRDEELAMLIRRWQQAKVGNGRVVLISGEPGIGKSRLTVALQDRLKSEPHTMFRYFCSPHHTDSAFHPVISQLSRGAGLERHDAPEAKLDKLALFLDPSSTRASDTQLVAELLSVPTGNRYAPLDWSPRRKKEETLAALLRHLDHLTRERPAVAVYEDVHWIDPSSQELLDLAIERVARLPALLVVTFRPEFQPPWIGQAHVTALSLSRLGKREGETLVGQMTGSDRLSKAIVAEIVERTDGIPLFVEELTKAVLEAAVVPEIGRVVAGGLSMPLKVPATLQSSLTARLDRLGPAATEIAQIGAAIGREFAYDLLATVAPCPKAEVQEALLRLCDAGVASRRGSLPDAVFLFKHALLQDAAYEMLPRSERRRLHGRIAESLEDKFPEIVGDHPEVLSRHCIEAGYDDKAIGYLGMAGARALARSANAEAASHLARAIGVLLSQPESTERDKREFELRLLLRPPLHATKGFASVEMQENLARAVSLGERLGETGKTLGLLSWQCTLNLVRATTTVTMSQVRRSISLSRQAGDMSAAVLGYRSCGYAHLVRGELRTARTYLERAMRLHDPNYEPAPGAEYVFLPGPMTESVLSLALQQLGQADKSKSMCAKALADARRAAHSGTIAYVSFHLALLHMVAGNVQEVTREAMELIRFMREKNISVWRWHCEKMLGWAEAKAGSLESGISRMRGAAAERQGLQVTLWAPFYRTREAEILSLHGRYDEALRRLDDAEAMMQELDQHYAEPEAHRLRGIVLSAKGAGPTEIENCFGRALKTARRQHAKVWELRAATSCADIWRRAGRAREARDLVAPVYNSFAEGFDTFDLAQARAVIDSA